MIALLKFIITPARSILLVVFFLVGCRAESTGVDHEKILRFEGEMPSYKVRTFEYEGCEYLAIGQGNSFTVTHKGNCKQCQERKK